MGPEIVALLTAFVITVVLSIVLGFQTEKWIHGSVQSLPRVLVNTLNILFTAGFVTWGVWALLAKFYIQ